MLDDDDNNWTAVFRSAEEQLRDSGRVDLADYVSLRAANDAVREKAVAWLFNAVSAVAGEANRRDLAIAIERSESHSFEFRGANIVGSLTRLRQGVRAMTVEAGWPRVPSDGFIRGNALAVARVRHFGMREHDADLLLSRFEGVPIWFADAGGGRREEFHLGELLRHFAVFVGLQS